MGWDKKKRKVMINDFTYEGLRMLDIEFLSKVLKRNLSEKNLSEKNSF